MKIINNIDLLLELNKIYHNSNKSLSFIFAPVNSGKTTSIRDFIIKKKYLYFNIEDINQDILYPKIMEEFCTKLNLKTDYKLFNSFEKIIDFLFKLNPNEKIAIILDNAHHIFKNNKKIFNNFLSSFNDSLNKNLQFIFTSSIIYNIPLKYNNDIYSYHLKPFHINTIIKEKNISKTDAIFIYSCFGSSNFILSNYNKKEAFISNLLKLLLNPTNSFFNYGDDILYKNFTEINTYKSILIAISNGNNKIIQIADFLNVKSTFLTRYLKNLQEHMIIIKKTPIDDNPSNSKLGRYYIEDNLLNFWFTYIQSNKNKLLLKKTQPILKEIDNNIIQKIIIPQYIDLLISFLSYNSEKHLGFKADKIGTWWNNKGDFIDIIAYNNEKIVFIKVIWNKNEITQQEYLKLQSSSNNYKTKLNKSYLIITKQTFLYNF